MRSKFYTMAPEYMPSLLNCLSDDYDDDDDDDDDDESWMKQNCGPYWYITLIFNAIGAEIIIIIIIIIITTITI